VSGELPAATGFAVDAHLGVLPWDLSGIEPLQGGWPALRAQLEGHESFHDVILCRRLPRVDSATPR